MGHSTLITYGGNYKWWIFIAAALAIMMVDIDITAANLALANIANDLRINISTVQWIIDGYMIAAASLMAFGGRLSDIYGAKNVFIFGLVLFALSSLAVGLSNGPFSIIVSRIVQGACIAFTFPVSMVIIRDAFPEGQQGFAIGLVITIAGLSQALGPAFGGIIIYILSWRWIFLLDIPLALCALLITIYCVPKSATVSNASPQVFGNTILTFGLLAIITALNEVNHFGINSIPFISLLLAGISMLLIFSFIEFRSLQPILDLRLLVNRNFLLINLIRVNFNFVYFSLLFALGLFLQNILGYSTLHASYLLLALTLVFGVIAIPCGKLVDKIGVKTPLLIGLFLLFIGTIFLASTRYYLTLANLLSAFTLIGLSIAFLVPASGAGALFAVPKERGGSAMGIFFTGGFIAAGLGVAISGLMLDLLSTSKLMGLLTHAGLNFSVTQIQNLKEIASGISTFVAHQDTLPREFVAQLNPIVHTAFLYAFYWLMLLGAILSFIGLLFAFALKFPKQS